MNDMKTTSAASLGQEIDTKAYVLKKDKYGIFHKCIKTDAHIDLKEVKSSDKICLAMNDGKKILTLIDARNFHSHTPEALKYLKDAHNSFRKATAVVSSVLSEKITVNYVKGKAPVKIFHTENEAVKWLMGFRQKP